MFDNGYLKVLFFQCYTLEWLISCLKLVQPNPCSFLLVKICAYIMEYLPHGTPVTIHSRHQLLRQASSSFFLQNLSSQPVAAFYLVLPGVPNPVKLLPPYLSTPMIRPQNLWASVRAFNTWSLAFNMPQLYQLELLIYGPHFQPSWPGQKNVLDSQFVSENWNSFQWTQLLSRPGVYLL